MKDEILNGDSPTSVFLKEIQAGRAESNADVANLFIESFPHVAPSAKSLIWRWDRLNTGRLMEADVVDDYIWRYLLEAGYTIKSRHIGRS